MSFFKNQNSIASVEPVITVSAETVAKVSNRVELKSQIIEFEADPSSDLIALVTRANTQDYSHRSKKGLVFIFDKNIKSGEYTFKNSPFANFYYFETGTIPGFTTSHEYKPTQGSFTVEVISNTSEKLHYNINFDFKAVHKGDELSIKGQSTYIVLFRTL
ncbi:hypothetical protein [Pseudomonas sp. H1h]|uniref:hypothetical protein n=1 Tax=Pseudomonas sp. H1h TaxID=1397280 RepID=UPI0004686A36|nr:hypothetical protein [Pseudomonas sp. H1h]